MNKRLLTCLVGALIVTCACNTDPNEAKKYVARGNKYYDKGKTGKR